MGYDVCFSVVGSSGKRAVGSRFFVFRLLAVGRRSTELLLLIELCHFCPHLTMRNHYNCAVTNLSFLSAVTDRCQFELFILPHQLPYGHQRCQSCGATYATVAAAELCMHAPSHSRPIQRVDHTTKKRRSSQSDHCRHIAKLTNPTVGIETLMTLSWNIHAWSTMH